MRGRAETAAQLLTPPAGILNPQQPHIRPSLEDSGQALARGQAHHVCEGPLSLGLANPVGDLASNTWYIVWSGELSRVSQRPKPSNALGRAWPRVAGTCQRPPASSEPETRVSRERGHLTRMILNGQAEWRLWRKSRCLEAHSRRHLCEARRRERPGRPQFAALPNCRADRASRAQNHSTGGGEPMAAARAGACFAILASLAALASATAAPQHHALKST